MRPLCGWPVKVSTAFGGKKCFFYIIILVINWQQSGDIRLFYVCSLHREFDEDMLSIKELNAEILSAVKDTDGDRRPDLLQLSIKANRLLKKILLRRFQLEQEAQYIRKMSSKVAAGELSEDKRADIDMPTGGIDQVINRLKTMIEDLDTGDNKEEVVIDWLIDWLSDLIDWYCSLCSWRDVG